MLKKNFFTLFKTLLHCSVAKVGISPQIKTRESLNLAWFYNLHLCYSVLLVCFDIYCL